MMKFLKRPSKKKNSYAFPKQASILVNISLEGLIQENIQGIILDLDNTIISEDDRFLSPHGTDWINRAKALGFKLFILSNGKRHYRVVYWSQYLDVPAISPAKKPFPKAFRRALKAMELNAGQVVVIGDSRHTDVLGAWWVGCPSIQVASLPHPPRWWEKLLGKYVQMPYPKEHELWDFQPLSHYGKH
jgi:HAD superfamily phosphatase (TIGR01668 family)